MGREWRLWQLKYDTWKAKKLGPSVTSDTTTEVLEIDAFKLTLEMDQEMYQKLDVRSTGGSNDQVIN